MSVVWSIAFVTPRVPVRRATWIRQILKRVGVETVCHGYAGIGRSAKDVGSMNRDAAARLCMARGLVSLDLGGPPVLRDLNASLGQSLPADVLGDARLHNASLRVGRHRVCHIAGEKERAATVGFGLSFWGYGSPRNSAELSQRIALVPAIKDLRLFLQKLVGPAKVIHRVDA